MKAELTIKEQSHIRAALNFLRGRCGAWQPIAAVIGVKPETLARIGRGNRPASAMIVFRVARFAKVGVDDVLSGLFPAPGTCPHCGHRPELQSSMDELDDEKEAVGQS